MKDGHNEKDTVQKEAPLKRPAAIQEEIEMLVGTYAREILLGPTRVVPLLGRKCEPRILHTFLGFELKVAQKRITCPDMSTALYLQIFAELGMPSVRAPYDPTVITRVLPELEKALKQIKNLLLKENLPAKRHQSKLRGIYKRIRDKLRLAEEGVSRDSDQ